MSVAIQRENGDLIWFDAVLTYQQSFSSSVSKHPIEGGETVTDNVTTQNPIFNISGVVSNADFNTMRPFISSSDATAYGISRRRIYNSQPIPDGQGPIIGSKASPILARIPVVGQFFEGQPPSVIVPDLKRPDWVLEVSSILEEIERNHERVALLEFKNSAVFSIRDDIYITNLTFNEDENTGDSVNVSVSLERVKFVTLLTASVSKETVKELEAQNTKKENKGNVNTPEEGTTSADSDPKKELKLTDVSALSFTAGGLGRRAAEQAARIVEDGGLMGVMR